MTNSFRRAAARALTLPAPDLTRVPFVRAIHQMVTCRSRLAAGVLLLVAAAGARAEPAPPADGWALLGRYLYRDAADVFRAAPGGPARDLGLAAALLNESPVTDGKIADAERMLRAVAAGADPAAASYARYLLARVLHQHRGAPIPEVERAYRAVIAADPHGRPAQLAAAHLALVELYQRPDLAVAARLDAAQALAPVAGDAALPEVAFSYYRALANAAMYYDVVDPRVIGWLKQACAIGTTDEITQSTLLLQVAETSRIIGDQAQAVAFYRRFLAAAVPTDQRYYTAQMRMRELEGGK